MITIEKTPNSSSPRDYTVTNAETGVYARVIYTSKDAALPNAWLLATPRLTLTRYKYRRYSSKYETLAAAIQYVDPEERLHQENI